MALVLQSQASPSSQWRASAVDGGIALLLAVVKNGGITGYWNIVMQHTQFRCIYSGLLLDPDHYALDHFLPWTFVGHDQLWNLVPVAQSVNSSKGNAIPDPSLITRLASAQHSALQVTRHKMPDKKWQQRTECFVTDLGVCFDENSPEPVSLNVLTDSMQDRIFPLMQVGKNMGFSHHWSYRP
jgi:hypothetical protein